MIKFKSSKVIGVDFDNTCVIEEWPEIGREIPGAINVLRKLIASGHKIILVTMREHDRIDGRDLLQEAIDWFTDRGIELLAVNSNPIQEKLFECKSRKIYTDAMIDDHSAGIKLLDGTTSGGVPVKYVDWNSIDNWFRDQGYY